MESSFLGIESMRLKFSFEARITLSMLRLVYKIDITKTTRNKINIINHAQIGL